MLKVNFDLNEMLSSIFSRQDYGKGLDRKTVENYLLEGLAVALKMCEYHKNEGRLYHGAKIYNGNCSLSEKSSTIYIKNWDFWELSVGEVSIDFLTGDIFVKDEVLHMEKDKDSAYRVGRTIMYRDKVKDNVKFDHKEYGIKYKKPIDKSIIDNYLPDNYKREVKIFISRYDYEKEDFYKFLSQYDYIMYNKENNYKGELTELNRKDSEDIYYDNPSLYFTEDGEKFIIEYPYNVCKLESVNK